MIPCGVKDTSRKREVLGRQGRRVNTVQKVCTHEVNAKMVPAETTPGIGVVRE
jgi:hypothetical protein